MKVLKNRSYVVAILVVVFIGIAGGFTNKEQGRWMNGDGCSVSKDYDKVPNWDGKYDPDKAAQDYLDAQTSELTEQEYCVTHHGGIWVAREKYWKPSVKGTSSYRLYSDSRTVFDPKSTALFAIAGMIMFLVSKEVRGREKTANDV